jgi:hypothetical protein
MIKLHTHPKLRAYIFIQMKESIMDIALVIQI